MKGAASGATYAVAACAVALVPLWWVQCRVVDAFVGAERIRPRKV
jgi:hypothetical protein